MGTLQRLLGRSDIIMYGTTYMERWRLVNAPAWLGGWGIRVHHILRSDQDRELHDHPFSFLSIIIKGPGYTEWTPCGASGRGAAARFWPRWSVILKRAEDLHRLDLEREFPLYDEKRSSDDLPELPVWTLVIRGPIRRQWGFATDKGWVHWKEFVKDRDGLFDPDYTSTDES